MSNQSKFYQGKFTPRFPEKYEGNIGLIIYRSSWELKFMNWCDTTSAVLKWSSEEIYIPYRCPTDNRIHRYFPDAKIKVKDSSGITKTYLVEIKPHKQTQPPDLNRRKTKQYLNEAMTWGKNHAKWNAARDWCRDRNYEFIILTEYNLGIKSS